MGGIRLARRDEARAERAQARVQVATRSQVRQRRRRRGGRERGGRRGCGAAGRRPRAYCIRREATHRPRVRRSRGAGGAGAPPVPRRREPQSAEAEGRRDRRDDAGEGAPVQAADAERPSQPGGHPAGGGWREDPVAPQATLRAIAAVLPPKPRVRVRVAHGVGARRVHQGAARGDAEGRQQGRVRDRPAAGGTRRGGHRVRLTRGRRGAHGAGVRPGRRHVGRGGAEAGAEQQDVPGAGNVGGSALGGRGFRPSAGRVALARVALGRVPRSGG